MEPCIAEEKTHSTMGVPSARKVMEFLHQIRGFNSFCNEDVGSFLYKHRFDLLYKPGSNKHGKLPSYSAIPTHGELHDILIDGSTQCGHQAIAHVLYPDSVPWPSKGSAAEPSPCTADDWPQDDSNGGQEEEQLLPIERQASSTQRL